MKYTFSKVVICYKTEHEPLHEIIERQMKENVEFYEDWNIPEIKQYKNNEQPIFMIFNDLFNAHKNVYQKISVYFSETTFLLLA